MEDLNLMNRSGGVVYGIDATSANKQMRTGVEQYARHLIQAMKNHPLQDGERVVLYSPTPLDEELGQLPQGWTSQVLSFPLSRGWMSIRMSWEMLRRAPQVLFVPGQAFPRITPARSVTMVHDIAFAIRPDLYPSDVRRRLHQATKRAVKKAAKLLVPSQVTARDVMAHYPVKEERVSVVPHAVDTSMYRSYSDQEVSPTLTKYRLGAHYFLVVGRLERKKNITNIVRAFELFKARRGVGDPFELVFAGKPAYGFDQMKKYFDHSSQKAHIRQIGYVPDEEVAHLMSHATAYLFPSWYEGFGIPNLEAMASGTALITSDIPAHKEVVGNAGVFVPPGEPEAWAHAMERVVDQAGVREQLIEQGDARVEAFSWERSAQQTWEVLRSLV